MTQDEIITTHEYIIEHDLLNQVEIQTRANWKTGSRTTYYSGVAKAREGTELSLSEGLMLKEAQQLMREHMKKENEPAQVAAA